MIGKHLDLPVASVSPDDASAHFTWMAHFIGLDSPASSEVTRELFDWHPTQVGLLDDLDQGHYFVAGVALNPLSRLATGSRPIAWNPYVEEDRQAQDQRPPQEGEPRPQAQRRARLTRQPAERHLSCRDLADRTTAVAHPRRRHGRRDPRDLRRRSVPLARGRRPARDPGVGRPPERPHPGRPRPAPRPRPGSTSGSAPCCGPARRWPVRRPASGCSPSTAGATTTRPSSWSARRPNRAWPAPSSTPSPSATTRPRPSTGTTRRATARWSPSASRPAATSAPPSTWSTSPSGARLDEAIPHTRAASVAWAPDNSGFAYTRYPLPGEVPDSELEYWRKVYWHTLGEPHERDAVVWEDLPDKTAWPNVSLSVDGRWLLVHVSLGWSRVDVHLIDRQTGSRTVMIEGIDAVSSFEVVGDQLIGVTTLDADRGRVVSAPMVASWHDNWCTIVAEGASVIEAAVTTPSSLLVLRSRSAVAQLDRYDHDGTNHRRSSCPSWARSSGLSASDHADRAFVSFTSFARPPTLLRWDGGELVRLEPAGRGRRRARRPARQLRGRAGQLRVDRRHRRAHVPHPVRGDGARRRHAVRAHRLRRLRGDDGPGLQRRDRGRVRRRRPLRRGQHPRRRRGGRVVAPRRHARAQAAELRRLRRRRRLAGRVGLDLAATASPSAAAATAGC